MAYKELLAQAEAIQASAQKEGREITGEELANIESLIEQAEQAKVVSEKAEQAKQKLASMSKVQGRSVVAPMARIEVGAPEFTKDPNKGFASAKDFFKAVVKNRGQVRGDDRLKFLAAAGSDEQSVGNDIYGGFLVPEGFISDPKSIALEANPLAGRTMEIPMDAPVVGLPSFVDEDHSSSVSAGITVSRKAETDAGASSRAKFRITKLSANTLFGLSYTTEELLADSPSSVASLLGQSFNKAFADKDFEELLRGTGVGEPEGILNANALIAVAKEGSQTADTIVKNNILKMRARCYGYGNAVWIANHDTFPQLAIIGGDGNGSGSLYVNSPSEDRPNMLLGRPIFFSEYAETLGDQGDLMLVDASQIYTGTYQQLQSSESIHVRFVEHERAFKFYKRNDARCAWRNALTPRKGASTLSPLVTLAARA